jgi:hypothetical protein
MTMARWLLPVGLLPAGLLPIVLLAGCAATGDWKKAGADDATIAREYQGCRALATTTVTTEADIDQDILATRQSDWQRAGAVRVGTETMQQQTRDRAARIIASCMQAKGFVKG